jgi:cellulose synthase/poly-beta-1,6-N-acetylglucosamine synthase-like glycosyltransferase
MARDDRRVRVLCTPAGRGKSAGVSAGVAAARYQTIVFADARQRFVPGAVRALAAPFADPRVGAVTGLLRIGAAAGAVEGVRMYWGMETALRMAEGRTGSVVGATGAIYAVRRALFDPLPPNVILDDVLVPMRIAMRGFRVVMAADAVALDEPSGDPAAEYRRKRRTMLGNLQLLRVCPALLLPWRNPLWARFVSHKLLRVASPACFVGMLATAALLPGPLYRAAFVGLAALYAAGFAGLVVRWRPLAVPAAFVLMHGAVFSAVRNLGRAAEMWTPRPADAAGR